MATLKDRAVAMLGEALTKLRNDHWIQGQYEDVNEQGELTYCSVGALNAVNRETQWDSRAHSIALTALAKELGASDETAAEYRAEDDEYEYWEDAVIRWNDTHGRSWDEIERTFIKAEQNLRISKK